MRTIISLILAIAFAESLAAQPIVRIGNFTFVLAFAPTNSADSVREYIPKGESLNHWSRMASVRIFPKEKNPRDYLNRVGDLVAQSNPAARGQLLVNDKTGDDILDFLMFTADDTTAEWNLMRARYEEGKGLVVFQYAVRFYTVDENLAPAINAERLKMIEPFGRATFEEIKETNKSPEPN
jgi:hypothetical protein